MSICYFCCRSLFSNEKIFETIEMSTFKSCIMIFKSYWYCIDDNAIIDDNVETYIGNLKTKFLISSLIPIANFSTFFYEHEFTV